MFGKHKDDKFIIWWAQIRNISDYENKPKEDLIKAPSETKPEKTKLEIRVNKRKFKNLERILMN